MKLSQAYSSWSRFQLYIVIVQSTSEICCLWLKFNGSLGMVLLMIGTVTLSGVWYGTNETSKLSSLSQQILCSKNHVCLVRGRVCLRTDPRAFIFSQISIFYIASFSQDTKQRVLIQYHPAVYFNWILQHTQICQSK